MKYIDKSKQAKFDKALDLAIKLTINGVSFYNLRKRFTGLNLDQNIKQDIFDEIRNRQHCW